MWFWQQYGEASVFFSVSATEFNPICDFRDVLEHQTVSNPDHASPRTSFVMYLNGPIPAALLVQHLVEKPETTEVVALGAPLTLMVFGIFSSYVCVCVCVCVCM